MKKYAKFLATLVGGGLATGLTQAFGMDAEMAGAIVIVVMGALTYAVPNAKAG